LQGRNPLELAQNHQTKFPC
jgi:hypothetical protein